MDSIYVGMMVFIRASVLFMAVPVFASNVMPISVRVALSAMFAVLITPYVSFTGGLPESLGELLLVSFNEAMLGFLMAMAVLLVFVTYEYAGHVIGQEIGLMRSDSLDPIHGSSSSTIGNLMGYSALLIFFIAGMHREMLMAFVRSFDIVPVGETFLRMRSLEPLIRDSSQLFVVGLQMAAPFVAVNFMVNLVFAVLGKAVPKMNVFMVSFSIRIAAGFVIFYSTVGLMVQFIYTRNGVIPDNMLRFLTF